MSHSVWYNMLNYRLLNLSLLCVLLMLADPVRLGSAEDYCSWRGSGLTWDSNSRAVEQVHLRCTEGFLEWMYPTRALRVILEPNLTNGKHTTICLKPCPNFKGANIYVEKGRVLQLLVSEASDMQQVHCFAMDNMQRVALFIQACPQEDIRRRTAGFQYELFNNQNSGPDLQKFALMDAICRPCDNAELLMAVCRSDFVVRGTIKNISHDQEAHTSHVDIRALNVYRQTNSIFQLDEATGEWTGRITTLLKCRVQKGEGDFLFTGNEHFGDAWLGCAPRFKDFLNIYQEAKHQRTNPCEFQFGFSLNIPAIV